MCSFIIIGVNTRQREQDRLYGVNRKTFVCKLWLMNQTQVFQQRQGVLQLGSRKHENVCGIQRKVKITISYLRYGESSCFLSAQNVLNVNVQNMLPKLSKHNLLYVLQPVPALQCVWPNLQICRFFIIFSIQLDTVNPVTGRNMPLYIHFVAFVSTKHIFQSYLPFPGSNVYYDSFCSFLFVSNIRTFVH